MTRKPYILIAVMILTLLATPLFAEQKKRVKAAGPKIAFSESYNPKSNLRLSSGYSKLKTALENEFGATVESLTTGWSNLSGYDIVIIPGRYAQEALGGDCFALRNWIENGGCAIILWYVMDWTSDRWGGLSIHDNVTEPLGISMAATPHSNTISTAFASPFNSTPYNVNRVSTSGKIAKISTTHAGAKEISRAGNYSTTIYRENIGAGKGQLYLISSPYAFYNSRIDLDDNKEFLFNIVNHCLGGGGGGGGGSSDVDLKVKRTKAKFRFFSPGDQITLIARIKNKSKVNAAATDVTFYLSPDKVLDASDVLLGTAPVPALNKRKGKRIKKVVILPLTLGAGVYYVIAIVDEAQLLPDKDWTNNVKASTKTIEIQ